MGKYLEVGIDQTGTSSSITGSGTANYVAKFSATTVITNSLFYDNGVSTGLGTASPSASAFLDITSTSQGFLSPRMTTAQRNAIVSPATGLWIYNTSTSFFNYWDGATWIQVDTSTGGDVSGSGTTNTLPIWTDGPNSVLGDSKITQSALATTLTFAPSIATTGAITPFTFTNPANTGQTAGSNISGFKYSGGSRQWSTGAITTQYESYFSSATYSAVGASVITDAYGAFFEAPTASTNITITNNWSAGFSGKIAVIGSNSIVSIAQIASTEPGIWLLNTATATSTGNFALAGFNSLNTLVNAPSTGAVYIYNAGVTEIARFTASQVLLSQILNVTPSAVAIGAVSVATFTNPANTNQTLSTEISGFKFNGVSRQWATGAITTQREIYFSATAYTAVGASTITDAYGMYVSQPTASTNITITNNWALGLAGGISLINNASYIAATGTGANGMILKNQKNSANTTVSGTAKTVEIDIGGTPYFFLVYPTSTA